MVEANPLALTENIVSPDIFWAEISPCEHIVQLYEDENAFLRPLAIFCLGGIQSGEGVLIIATRGHIALLEAQLSTQSTDFAAAKARGQYRALEAEEILASFMVNGWPDDALFRKTISELLTPMRPKYERVRAFGEMVALLWAQGHTAATVRLEYLWHELYQPEAVNVLCAYPRAGFTQTPENSIDEIFKAHSRILHTPEHSK